MDAGPNGSDGAADGELYLTCEALSKKYRSCGLLGPGDFECVGHSEACTMLCELEAPCDTLEALVCDTIDDNSPFWLCFLDCLTGPSGFVCEQDGKAIARARFCDGAEDCVDGSDERQCPAIVCDFHWNNVVPEERICDGIEDCFTAEDEADCPDFTCADGSALPHGVRCNGSADCFDASDERDCDLHGSDALRCPDGELISTALTCNGSNDCADGVDEAGCDDDSECTELYCGREYVFVCSDGTVISDAQVCDEQLDCDDASDEPCSDRCGDGTLIDAALLCDGTRDCADGADESNCGSICDGFRDNDDWSDELNCCDDPPCAELAACPTPLPSP